MNKIFYLVVFCMLFLIFGPWFFHVNIIGGDWLFLYQDFLKSLPFVPPSWSPLHSNGLGGKIIIYSLDSYLYASSYLGVRMLHLPWNFVYKIFWFGAFLAISFFGSIKLGRYFFIKNNLAVVTTALIVLTNTYILMVSGGGQMGIVLAYSLAPLLLVNALMLNENPTVKRSLRFSLLLALLMSWDIRIFSIMFLINFIVSLFTSKWKKSWSKEAFFRNLRHTLIVFVIPYSFALFLNAFWIYPNLLHPYNPLEALGKAYTSIESLKFFSFATFSNTFSILHPNWPDNVFGKIVFQRPEFLIFPLLAFLPLIFLKKEGSRNIVVLSLIALIGIFLAKGASEPFGNIYVYLYDNVPGFRMFRDSTKWYLMIILAYSILIPYSLDRINGWVKKKRKILNGFIFFAFIFIWVFSIRDALMGNLKGTFTYHTVPVEYEKLAENISSDKEFYRTLWVPRQQRFTYYDYTHPAVEALPLFGATNAAELSGKMKKAETQAFLKKLSIKYIIIPDDALGEIFLQDRKYAPVEREKYEKVLDEISYLTKKIDGKITLYSTSSYNSLFSDGVTNIPFRKNVGSAYVIETDYSTPTKIIFSQNYSPSWEAFVNDKKIEVSPTGEKLMSIQAPSGKRSIDVVFSEQSNYNVGWIISIIVFFGLIVTIFTIKKR